MADTQTPRSELPGHIEETIRSIGRLHTEHRHDATGYQRAVHRATALLGGPGFVGVLGVFVGGWIALNLECRALGHEPFDPPPFSWLEGAISLLSLLMVTAIVGEQRREDQIAQQRELLTLQLAILTERKTAKIIALLEELRRDSPHVHDRIDEQAEDMARPANPHSVLDAIKETDAVHE